MNPPNRTRCPLCRDAVEANHKAWSGHIKSHNWADRQHLYWWASPPLAILIWLCDAAIVAIPAWLIGTWL